MERAKILLVDDKTEALDILEHSLEDQYDLVTAIDGEQALKQLKGTFHRLCITRPYDA